LSGKGRFSKALRKSRKNGEGKVHYDKHHIYPRSRKKKGALGKFKALLGSLRLCTEIKAHTAWHHLFGRMFPEEAVALLKAATQGGLYTAPEIIAFIKHSLQPHRAVSRAVKGDLDAWRKIFAGYTNFRPLRKIIIKNWAYPGIKATVLDKRIVKVAIFLPKISQNDRLLGNIYRCRNIRVSSFKDGRLLKIS
jgi:hypothetical protein